MFTSNKQSGEGRTERNKVLQRNKLWLVFLTSKWVRQFPKLFICQFKLNEDVAMNEFLLHSAFLRVKNIHYETIKSSNSKLCCVYLVT